jgi:hypothetical protein
VVIQNVVIQISPMLPCVLCGEGFAGELRIKFAFVCFVVIQVSSASSASSAVKDFGFEAELNQSQLRKMK